MPRPTSQHASLVAIAAIASAIALTACGGPNRSDLTRAFGTEDADDICELRDGSCDSSHDGDDDAAAAAAAVRGLQRAFLDGDVDALCERMTRSANSAAGSFAHGIPETCGRNVRHGFRIVEQGGGWRHLENPEVAAVDVAGDRATATVLGEQRRPAEAELIRQGGDWKLDAPFGLPLALAREHVAAAGSAPFPAPRGRPVTPLDRAGKPCPPIGDGTVAGEKSLLERSVPKGCRVRVMSGRMDFVLQTAFGDFSFETNCRISDFQFAMGGDGRTWMDGMDFLGDSDQGCGDVYRCEQRPQINPDPEGPLAPWKGRLSSDGDGGFVNRMNACVATCVGFFTGQLAVRLRRHGDRWRLSADRARVGKSGFELDGQGPVKGSLRIRTAPLGAVSG